MNWLTQLLTDSVGVSCIDCLMPANGIQWLVSKRCMQPVVFSS